MNQALDWHIESQAQIEETMTSIVKLESKLVTVRQEQVETQIELEQVSQLANIGTWKNETV